MRKKGFTIVELIVSMAIFAVITTLAVGSFVSINRFRDLGTNMAESQQKVRVAAEMISRLSRQAQEVVVSADGQTLEMGFNMDGTDPTNSNNHSASFNKFSKFEISNGELYYYPEKSCLGPSPFNGVCQTKPTFSATDRSNLLQGVNGVKFTLSPESNFSLPQLTGLPLRLNLTLTGTIGTTEGNKDDFRIDTSVVLENVGA